MNKCCFCPKEMNPEEVFFLTQYDPICDKCYTKFNHLIYALDANIETGMPESVKEQCKVIDDIFRSLNSKRALNKDCKTEEESKNKVVVANKDQKTINVKKNSPVNIKRYIDKFVVGQEEAKKVVATAVYNHYIRINNKSKVNIPKNNLMLIGNTGVGKTYLVEIMSNILRIPFVIADCSNLTQTGWKGNNINTILSSLIMEANYDINKAQKGIVLLDEIDKLALDNKEYSSTTKGVQQCLLKVIEGIKMPVEVNRRELVIDTKDILFIGSGAFIGLKDIINKRVNNITNIIGFNYSNQNLVLDEDILFNVNGEDIVSYGFMPEFIGRMPTITALHDLGYNELRTILLDVNDSLITQYKHLFKSSGINLKFSEEIINHIVNLAIEEDTGARSLKTITENIMRELMFYLPDSGYKEFTVDLSTINYGKNNLMEVKNENY